MATCLVRSAWKHVKTCFATRKHKRFEHEMCIYVDFSTEVNAWTYIAEGGVNMA